MRNEQQIKAIFGQINDLFGFNVTQGLEMASSQPIFHLQVLRGVEQFIKVFPMIIEEVALITTTEVANNIIVKRLCETGNCSYQVAKRICRRVAPAKSNVGAYMVAMYKNDPRRIVAFSHYTKKEMEQVLEDMSCRNSVGVCSIMFAMSSPMCLCMPLKTSLSLTCYSMSSLFIMKP